MNARVRWREDVLIGAVNFFKFLVFYCVLKLSECDFKLQELATDVLYLFLEMDFIIFEHEFWLILSLIIDGKTSAILILKILSLTKP